MATHARTRQKPIDDHPFRVLPLSIRERGACLGYPRPHVFFADDTSKPGVGVREARLVCASCPVRQECLNYSLAADEPFGVWGGLDRWDRTHLLGKRSNRFSEKLHRPLVSTSLPCDSSACFNSVPLDLTSTLLSSSGNRYCHSCFLACTGQSA